MHWANRTFPLAAVLLLTATWARAAIVLDDFEEIKNWKPENSNPSPRQVEPPPGGKGAVQIDAPAMVSRNILPPGRPSLERAQWDNYQGLSFWVKGDGSDQYGCLAVGENHPLWGDMHSYFFPLKDTSWRKYTVAWDDFISESHRWPLASRGCLPPSGLQFLRIGTRWTIQHNNAPIPKHSYSIGHIELELKVENDRTVPKLRDFSHVMEQLKAKKPVHVVCMGDSITAGTSLSPAEAGHLRYAAVIQKSLRTWLGHDKIVVESRAVGGAHLRSAQLGRPRSCR